MMATTTGERTVFVVDDDDAARDSLVMLLKSDGLATKGFASAHEFLAKFDTDLRGCVVTDLRMPSMDGIELIRELKSLGCLLPVIVITGHADVSRAVDAMKAGATDFIEKPYESEQLLRAVRGCIEENDVAVDANAARTRVLRRLESLTGRERQVLDLIVEGASNKVIASTLSISPRTVEIYRANVMSKMRAESLSDLIRSTISAGAA
jgi:two-component system, LuxR family, response regulator FixJ